MDMVPHEESAGAQPAPAPTPARAPTSTSRRLVQGWSTALAFAGLAAFAVWGVRTHWRFGWPLESDRFESRRSEASWSGSAEIRVRDDVDANAGLVKRGSSAPSLWDRGLVLDLGTTANVEKAGIEVAPIWTEPMTESIVANGETQFDPNKIARISALASGTAWQVVKTVGDWTKRGELLAIVDAPAVSQAKAEFQQALVQSRLTRQALGRVQAAGAALPDRKRQEAEATARQAETALLCAQQDLINLGLPARIEDYQDLSIDALAERMRLLGFPEWTGSGSKSSSAGSASGLLPLRSPLEGMVLATDLVPGEVATTGKTLFTIADPRRLWLILHVRAQDAGRIALGQTVKFRPDGSEEEFPGRVIGIGAAADEASRTVPARVELDNASGRLKASALGRGRIIAREAPEAVTAPNEAIQSFRGESIVFLRDPRFFEDNGPKAFAPRKVRVGARGPERSEILEGLRSGDAVAVQGADFLLRELGRFAVKGMNPNSNATAISNSTPVNSGVKR